MTHNDFRRIALGMDGAIDSAHMGHPIAWQSAARERAPRATRRSTAWAPCQTLIP